MNRFYPVILGVLFALTAVAETTLKEALTPEEFAEFGLSKLNPEELDALSSWITDRVDLDLPVDPVENFGFEQLPEYTRKKPESKAPKVIRSRLVGFSEGWSGGTRFRLENGQVWRQTDTDRFYVGSVDQPEVIIKRGLFGTYFLRFKGWNSACKVERVE